MNEPGFRLRRMVVEASVSLKWVLDDEEAVVQATALRDEAIARRIEMAAPSLWVYEVTNGLVTAVRRDRLTTEWAEQVLGHLMSLGIRLADPEVEDVSEQAVRYGRVASDAAYLALANALDARLWTGDRHFFNAVKDRVGFVCWIGDCRPES